ncbi:GNAT family N-acetyltransferase [Chondromyces apiculatus]|uniref:N-acetyltransferase domain-containing protein n=1 Tax=Chondromyces apiculatus DSM 436 TaxID=1192034 RepID=A0A017SVY8_9BACT|nr:GNAT family N-acetyltransferase [Chondromyces apiculatus]EYF01138.1 Hypothetical protein CAP_8643 [Chondromyces apiculatus DSM 436]
MDSPHAFSILAHSLLRTARLLRRAASGLTSPPSASPAAPGSNPPSSHAPSAASSSPSPVPLAPSTTPAAATPSTTPAAATPSTTSDPRVPVLQIVLTHPRAPRVSADAGQILRDACPPPTLHYSDEYVAWHLGFPGPSATAAIVRSGSHPAGVFAITPRRFQLSGATSTGHLLSLLAVRPEHQGQDLDARIYTELLNVVQNRGLLTLLFADAHCARSQLLLMRTVERLGFRMKRLHPLVNHGWSARRAPPRTRDARVARVARDIGEVIDVIGACDDDHILWAAPDAAQLEHYLRDPRTRRLLVLEEEGRLTAAATVMLGEVVNKPGSIVQLPIMDALWIPEPTVERITALFRGTEILFEGSENVPRRASLVSAPNVSTLHPKLLSAAGLRPTGAVYDGFLLHPTGHPFLHADATNLEVA